MLMNKPSPDSFSEGVTTLHNGEIVKLATPSSRIIAKFIDWLVVATIIAIPLILSVILADLANTSQTIANQEAAFRLNKLLVFTVFVTAFLYEPYMLARNGQTFGRAIADIRVVRIDDGDKPTFTRSTARALIYWFFGLFNYLPLMWNKNSQGIHNKITATVVVFCRSASKARPQR